MDNDGDFDFINTYDTLNCLKPRNNPINYLKSVTGHPVYKTKYH